MNKKIFISAALLFCLSLTACSEQSLTQIDTGSPSDSEIISDTAYKSEYITEGEGNWAASSEENAKTEITGLNTETEATAPTAGTTEAPPDEWTETGANTLLYINTDGAYSTEKPLSGSSKTQSYKLNQAVTVIAYTDTGYCKTADGRYIHNSFLSAEKTSVSTTAVTTAAPKTAAETAAPVTAAATTAAPVTTVTTAPPPVTTTTTTTTAAPPVTDKGTEEFIGRYNQRLQEQWEIDFSNRVFELTNEYRVKNGKSKFKKLDDLDKVAAIRAWEILYDYRSDHTRPDGEKFSTAYTENGIQYHFCGENIAAGQSTPEEVMDAWINSSAHRSNILSDKFTYLSVGMYYKDDEYRYYWAQEFCSLFE